MKILAFDTSSSTCLTALQIDDHIKISQKNNILQQGKIILPMIQDLLQSHSLKLTDLDAIAYGAGPGSFTGIRLASSIAQALGFAAHLPIIAISSLAIMAETLLLERHWPTLLIALDARGNQIYHACYAAQNGSMELLGQEMLCFPHDSFLPNEYMTQDWYGAGDGWLKYPEHLMRHKPKDFSPVNSMSAHGLLKLAHLKYNKREWTPASEALPVYLKNG
jgi:tRNA threonylcarbamoyladenosine biosynthesis protein TsaB